MLNNQEISVPVLIKDLGMMYPTETSKKKTRYGLYKCHCGNEFKAMSYDVKRGATKSCGCYNKQRIKEVKTTHGMRNHKIYSIWVHMTQRTYNLNSKDYKNYGGRGIKVCERWLHSFENFRDDMLPTWEEGLTIDRIDNNGNYEPNNCRWTTKTIQSRNTRVLMSTNTSGYRGVARDRNKWRSTINVNGVYIYIGNYHTALEAAKAYDTYVLENNLEHTINGVL